MGEVKPAVETFAKIKVIGTGGSGGSAVNRMIKSKIKGVEFIVANTDVQALHYSQAPTKIHLGKSLTRGLGAGMNPDVGKAAAEESQNEIRETLKGADMVFITCGLGGGTGSGSAPVIAEIARDSGALTVAVVTKPFGFEGAQRRDIAERAYENLAEHVDAIISIPNDKILQLASNNKKMTFVNAFETVDDVLRQGVQGISEVITIPGLINVDFADVKAVMTSAGTALMGIGSAKGENRAVEAAKQAISSPLLEVAIDGAKGILFTITGGSDLGMHEVSEAAQEITAKADPNAKVIFGTVIDESLDDELKICVIATGFDGMVYRKKNMEKSKAVNEEQNSIKNEVTAKEAENQTQNKREAEMEKNGGFFRRTIDLTEEKNTAATEKTEPKKAPAFSVTKAVTTEEDELEIPAFLRRKLK